MSPNFTKHLKRLTSAFLLCLLTSCAQKPVAPVAVPAPQPAPAPAPVSAVHQAVGWSAVDGWSEDDPAAAWPALRLSCGALQRRPQWQPVCEAARALGDQPGRARARAFFEQHFQPWRLANPDGEEEGLVTGYYEPLIQGSLSRSGRYAWPIHGVPKDMLTIELGDVYPELKSLRLRGRVVGNKVLPYWSRAELEQMQDRLPAPTLMWAADPIELFFLQVQGSGRVQLPDGRLVRIGYADQNGHPYQSIGRWLVAQGELSLDQASMQGIRQWAENNPQRLHELLNANPSYVFFRQLPSSDGGPVGALGVPLSAGRSIAVDPRFVPLGAPVFLATSEPQSDRPLNRLVLAQDTGGAIKGAVRADFFWGFGHDAGQLAGRMKQPGRMWLMLPKGMTPPAPPTKS
jgi:membrane-bound lytic murein transglycosylase A